MNVLLVQESSNRKTGPIPVSISSNETCPSTCALKEKGCYAKYSFLGIQWKRITNGKNPNATNWLKFCKAVTQLPIGQLWRHNAAGDLPGRNTRIATRWLSLLVKANRGKRGFTYTHKPVIGNDKYIRENRKAIKDANQKGLTINLSADSIEQADKYMDLNIGPVCVVLPSDAESQGKVFTPNGHRVVICPAQKHENITCSSCQLCAVSTRKTVVGFLAHGTAAKTVSQRAALPIVE